MYTHIYIIKYLEKFFVSLKILTSWWVAPTIFKITMLRRFFSKNDTWISYIKFNFLVKYGFFGKFERISFVIKGLGEVSLYIIWSSSRLLHFDFFVSFILKGSSFIIMKIINFARYITVSLWGPVLNLTARVKPKFVLVKVLSKKRSL